MTWKLTYSFIRKRMGMILHMGGKCLHTREACPFIREEKCSLIRGEYDMSTQEVTGILHTGGQLSFIREEHEHDTSHGRRMTFRGVFSYGRWHIARNKGLLLDAAGGLASLV